MHEHAHFLRTLQRSENKKNFYIVIQNDWDFVGRCYHVISIILIKYRKTITDHGRSSYSVWLGIVRLSKE